MLVMLVDVESPGSKFVPKVAPVMVREGYFGFLDFPSSSEEKERFISLSELWCSIRWKSGLRLD